MRPLDMAMFVGHLKPVTTITIASLKDRLSEILERVEAGEEITVCRRKLPVAVLRPASDLTSSRSWADVQGWMDNSESAQLKKDVARLRKSEARDPFVP